MGQDDAPIRETRGLAYRLWEAAGRPEGQADRFWQKAKSILWHQQATVREFNVTDLSGRSPVATN